MTTTLPSVVSPHTLAEATLLLADSGRPYRPIAGGTDLMVQPAGETGLPPARLLDLSRLDELRGIAVDPTTRELVLGALTTYTEIRRSEICREHLPAIVEAASTIGAIQIQNRGTIGGNAVNASPAGDTLPILLAADATIVLGSVRGERSVAADEFWTGCRRTARAADELVISVRVPLPPRRQIRFRKVGTRRAQAISKVVLALAWREEAGVLHDVRVAIGAVAATPIRARETEKVLEGAASSRATGDRAAAAVAAEIEPIDDVRSTADYRRAVTARILHRILRDAGGW